MVVIYMVSPAWKGQEPYSKASHHVNDYKTAESERAPLSITEYCWLLQLA